MKTLNLKQIGYQQASFADNLKGLARSVYEQYPNLDDEVSDEVKAELNAGYQLRVAENQSNIDQHFVVENGNYLPVEKLAFDNHKGEKYHRTVANIMAYTPQAFGALRQSNPQLHAVIKAERDSVSKYCSNRLADLKKAIHASLESIRETVQANSGGNKDKARDIIRRVKEWGDGKRTNKATNAKGNAKQALDVWALKWDNFTSSYLSK
jgi:hypothetical protein